MSIKAPVGCKTPKQDGMEYGLTMADIRFMKANAERIWAMLSYYANMPENGTGDIIMLCRNKNKQNAFNELLQRLDDIQTALNDIEWRYD